MSASPARETGPGDAGSDARAQPSRRLTTKTDAGLRLVPILSGAQRALEQLYVDAHDTSERAPVFTTVERWTRDGITRPPGGPLSPRMVTLVFRRYAERAGLPTTVRLHDLRHTAITNAIGQGEDVLLITAFAGHRKPPPPSTSTDTSCPNASAKQHAA